jgi:uncharacterized protein YbjT (DUF2867 family)
MAGHDTILVTGATGRVGGQVTAQLSRTGATVRALVRDPGTAVLPDGVEVVRGDLADAGSLDAALKGVDSVFLVFPTMRADHAAPAVIAAIAEHARRLVYLSAAGVSERATGILASHAGMEGLIESSGLEWTFLRPSGFAANTLAWADQVRAGNVVRWFYAAATRSLIHEYDIGAVGVRMLTEQGHGGARYHLSGPEQLTQAQQVETIGAAIGRPTRFDEITTDDARQEFFADLPTDIVKSIMDGQAEFLRQPEAVTSTVADLTGTPARTYRQWVTDHAADFR